jgi:hypothetical protein
LAKQREQLGTTATTAITINNSLDAPLGGVLQLSDGIIPLSCEVLLDPHPLPTVPAGGEVNEDKALAMMEDYFLYRVGVNVPRTVTHIRIHHLVEFIHHFQLNEQWVHSFNGCNSLIEVVLTMVFEQLERVHLLVVARCPASSFHHLSQPLVSRHFYIARH